MSSNSIVSQPLESIPAAALVSRQDKRRRTVRTALLTACTALLSVSAFAQTTTFVQTNIVSDGTVAAEQVDPTLLNPWGVSVGPLIWIDAEGSGLSLVETTSGMKSFAVTIPPAAASSTTGQPTGTVYNPNTAIFDIPNSGSATFLFATLDGTIAGWNQSTPDAVTVINNSSAKASYTDMALDTNSTGTFLLAANFTQSRVDIFNSSFAPAQLTGTFTDPQMPAGYSPFGIHSIGSNIYVTYAQLNPTTGHETVGAGLGYVDVFDNNGNLVSRAISQGPLNAPWGMAVAPAGFGSFAGDLLVGNFGDGVINAFNPTSFALVGSLSTSTGPIANPGLWEIFFGQTVGQTSVGDPNTLYFAAGLNGGADGLFGSISPVPAAGSPDFSLSAGSSTLSVTSGQTGMLSLSLTGANGFSGPVTLACSGLPSGATCAFSPATVTLSGTTAMNVSASITAPAASSTPTAPVTTAPPSGGGYVVSQLRTHSRITIAFLAPLGLFAFIGVRRRSAALRGIVLLLALGVISLSAVGCSSSMTSQAAMTTSPTTATPATPATPAPVTTQVTINATSGSTTHSVTVALSVM